MTRFQSLPWLQQIKLSTDHRSANDGLRETRLIWSIQFTEDWLEVAPPGDRIRQTVAPSVISKLRTSASCVKLNAGVPDREAVIHVR